MQETKIATICHKVGGGGAERVASVLSRLFPRELGHEFIVFERVQNEYPIVGEIRSIESPSKSNFLSKFISLIERCRRVRKIKKENKYQVCLSHLYSPNITNALSSRRDKSILVVHGPASLFLNPLQKIIAKRAYKKSSAIVSVSKYFALKTAETLNIRREKIYTIYNPIEIEEIKNKSNEELNADETRVFQHPVFLSVGRFSEQKAQWHAIRAFSKIHESNNNAQLVFLGDGPDNFKAKLKQLVSQLKIQNNVHFLGNVKNPFKYMSKAFALFYTSRWDAMPMVIIESLACSLPIITADCDSGPREILAPESNYLKRTKELERTKYGFLCSNCKKLEADSIELSLEELQFSEAGINLLSNREQYSKMKENCISRALDFDGEKIINKYVELINKLAHE